MTETMHLNINLNEAIENAKAMLEEDMHKYPSFDPDPAKYAEKNYYFNRANQTGILLMRAGLPLFAENYYEELLAKILEFERTHGKNFNKGMVYANLGINEIRGGKFEVGIAHLLNAEQQDRPVTPNFEILNEILWQQFEQPQVFDYFVALHNPNIVFNIDYPFLTYLVRELSTQDRIFFEGTILSLQRNRRIMDDTPNSYSLGRLYSALKDICLLTESLLRKHQISQQIFRPSEQRLLPFLLETAVGNQLFNRSTAGARTYANNLQEFLNQLENLATHAPIEQRWLYYLVLVRNFTGHHFDISDNVLSANGQNFFPALFDLALENVLLALLYLKSEGAY